MLTLQQLKDMPDHTIFAHGTTIDAPDGINMANTGNQLRWIAKRGQIHDWAIYIHFAIYDEDYIKAHGDKVTNEHHIKKLVPCNDEAFGMYRY